MEIRVNWHFFRLSLPSVRWWCMLLTTMFHILFIFYQFCKYYISFLLKSHFLRKMGKNEKIWKWCLQIFFIFGYFAQNNENRHQLKFFGAIPSGSWDIGLQNMAQFGQKLLHITKLLLWRQILFTYMQ